jgi:hypothetical protein
MKYPNIYPKPSVPDHSAFAALALALGARVYELDRLSERTKDVQVPTVGPTSVAAQLEFEIRRMRIDEGEGFLTRETEATEPRHRNVPELTRRATGLREGNEVKARFLEYWPRDHRIEVTGLVYEDGDYLMVSGWIIARLVGDGPPEISDNLTYLRKQA